MSRFTVEFPDSVDQMLTKLATEEQTNKREIIRRAIALYNYLHENGVKTGGERKVAITDKQDQVVKEILF